MTVEEIIKYCKKEIAAADWNITAYKLAKDYRAAAQERAYRRGILNVLRQTKEQAE